MRFFTLALPPACLALACLGHADPTIAQERHEVDLAGAPEDDEKWPGDS